MGGWGSVTPRVAGVQGLAPVKRRAMRDRRLACPPGKQPPLRGVGRCARRSARRDQAGRVRYPGPTPPKPPARLGRSQGRGCATQAPGRLAQRARLPGAQAEGSSWPTLIRGPAATEHLRSDRARSQAPGPGCPAGAPPKAAAAWRRSGKRAALGADPRATDAQRAQRAEQARRPAARVGRGRPAGRGVRAAAARQQGAPLPFPGCCPVRPVQARGVRAAGPLNRNGPGGAPCL